jgi:hypothetical protein
MESAAPNVKEQKSAIDTTPTAEKSGMSWSGRNLGELSGFEINSDNSTELVIGLNKAEVGGYNSNNLDAKLSTIMSKYGGEIVNRIIMGGEVVAVVVKAPISAVSSLTTDTQITGLASREFEDIFFWFLPESV